MRKDTADSYIELPPTTFNSGGITVRDALQQAASCIAADEFLTEADIQELRRALETVEEVVSLAATASPAVAACPDIWEFLDDDGKSEHITEVERRRND